MSNYKRKTRDIWEVQGWYTTSWETVTTEETWKAAREQVKCYRSNEPQYPHRVRMVRERIENESQS